MATSVTTGFLCWTPKPADANAAVTEGFADVATDGEAKDLCDLSCYAGAPASLARRDGRAARSEIPDIRWNMACNWNKLSTSLR
jgi:hypothetical protein